MHGMKSLLIYSILSLVLLSSLPVVASVSITVNTNGGSPYTSSTGNLLNSGSVIRVGYFDISSPASLLTLQTINDYSAINSLFRPLGENISFAGWINTVGSLTNYLVVNNMFAPGAIFDQIVGINVGSLNPANSSFIAPSSDLSVWVFNSSTPQSASEWGIFSASTGWELPSDLGSSTLSTFEVDTVIRGVNTGSQLQLSLVPEPSGLLLLLISVCAIARRRA
jgi:hypothetical protein